MEKNKNTDTVEVAEKKPSSEKKGKVKRKKISKVEELQQVILEKEDEIKNLKDKFLRKVAELENFRKRSEKEFSNIIKYANEDLIISILPVIDDLERSIKSSKNSENFETFVEGLKLVYGKFLKILRDKGVEPIEAVGKAFDPEKHEALMLRKSRDHKSHTVIEEYEKGYMLHDKVIRHSKVIVSE